jgi:hypothetical protein
LICRDEGAGIEEQEEDSLLRGLDQTAGELQVLRRSCGI